VTSVSLRRYLLATSEIHRDILFINNYLIWKSHRHPCFCANRFSSTDRHDSMCGVGSGCKWH